MMDRIIGHYLTATMKIIKSIGFLRKDIGHIAMTFLWEGLDIWVGWIFPPCNLVSQIQGRFIEHAVISDYVETRGFVRNPRKSFAVVYFSSEICFDTIYLYLCVLNAFYILLIFFALHVDKVMSPQDCTSHDTKLREMR